MNKKRGDSRLYSTYVWSLYWNGVGFAHFIGFCDDTESVIGDICCRMSNSKPCLVSVEHSAVAEGYLFATVSLRWSNGGKFCRCILCHRRWVSFKRRAFFFCVSCPSLVWNRRQFTEALNGVLPIFLLYPGENVYYSLNVNNAHLVDSKPYHSYNKRVSTHLLHLQC
jgi:hypothetical protein